MRTRAFETAKHAASTRGFSLIEVTIGLLILGLLMVPTIALYKKYRDDHIRAANTNNPGDVSKALLKYVLLQRRYPRPARPDLGVNDANFGREAPAGGFPNCTASSTTVCKTTGPRQILIGVVPFAELGLPREMAFDGYGRRLTYAVKQSLTSAGAFPNPANETFTDGIRITDLLGGDAPGTSGANVHFVIIAHGEDGRGAFTNAAANKFAACLGAGRDLENCDNDSIFNFNNNPTPCPACNTQAPQISLTRNASGAPSSSYFDDYLVYQTSTVGRGEKWSRYAGTQDVVERTGSPVRIGSQCGTCTTPNPQAALEVWGNVRGTDVMTDRLCASGASGCGSGTFTSTIIAGTPIPPPSINSTSYSSTGIRCGRDLATSIHQPMVGIASSNEKCLALSGVSANLGLPPLAPCPPGQGPVGINASGGLVCAPP